MRAPTGLALMLVVWSVQAVPLLDTRLDLSIRDGDFTTTVGVPATNRTIFALISLLCVGLLSFLLGRQTPKSLEVVANVCYRIPLQYSQAEHFNKAKIHLHTCIGHTCLGFDLHHYGNRFSGRSGP